MKIRTGVFALGVCLFCYNNQIQASEDQFIEPYSVAIDYRSLLARYLDCTEDMASLLCTCRGMLYAPEDATLQDLAYITTLYQKVYWVQNNGSNEEIQEDENRLFCWLYHEIKNMH